MLQTGTKMVPDWRKVAAEARVCERTARRWAKGLPVSDNVDARMADATRRLGLPAVPRGHAQAAVADHASMGGSQDGDRGHHGSPGAEERGGSR